MTERPAFERALHQLSESHQQYTSLCLPILHAIPVNFASVCTLGAPFGSETVCASASIAATFDELQFDLGEGPSWDAMHTRRPVFVDDVHSVQSSPWPALQKATRNIDVGSVYAFPLSVGSLDIGAVSLFSRGATRFTDEIIDDAEALIRVVARLVLRRSLIANPPTINLEDNEGYSRRIVHQATGMVLAQLNLSAADALLVIHGHAFSQGQTVREVATNVVTRRLDFSLIVES